ncbi:complement C1q tumor necrosis factor-related protein 3-like [Dendronephthya gigantea]|uniref:complement C1q tumor necrosis factor-related protein 3-like n=1 Tax=Dendronephthya gigantea TaxID=151771 RepID=UPI00106B43C6|nr:complement C1q tumor necrosis factor-related protein 3-like [Dendronephthya gigantea]
MSSLSSIKFALLGLVLVTTGQLGVSTVVTERRTLNVPLNGGITLNFEEGMRDFIVNGKGVGIQGQTLIAFQATLTSSNIGPNYTDGAIKFIDVALNIGNGYNPSTGKFTAPTAGLYQFTATYLQRNGYNSRVRLMRNNNMISKMHSTFWVELRNGSTYAIYGWSAGYTEFSGFLLSASL